MQMFIAKAALASDFCLTIGWTLEEQERQDHDWSPPGRGPPTKDSGN